MPVIQITQPPALDKYLKAERNHDSKSRPRNRNITDSRPIHPIHINPLPYPLIAIFVVAVTKIAMKGCPKSHIPFPRGLDLIDRAAVFLGRPAFGGF